MGVESLTNAIANGDFLQSFMLACLAGFLTALSPCIYPLIPITLSIIGTSKYPSRLYGFGISLCYVLGMATLYTFLGVFSASFGVLIGSALQNPWVNFGIGVMFVALALSMFGVYDIFVPQKLLVRLTRFGGVGFKGAFLMGTVAGVIAAPCTGPVLVFILTLIAANKDLLDVVSGTFLMAGYSLGIGIPFLILGTFSQALTVIPKSGSWMRLVKGILGLAMLAGASYYFNLAFPEDDVSHSEIGWHIIDEKSPSGKFDELLKTAREKCQPVVLDFYADWCAACKELDRKTYGDKKVQAELARFLAIKIDATRDGQELEHLQRQFAVRGLPTVVLLTGKGALEPKNKIFGFIDARRFLDILRSIPYCID